MSNYSVVDIETGIDDYLGRKGCYITARTVSMCWKRANKEPSVYYKDNDWNKILEKELMDVDIIVAFNAKFECLHFYKYKAFQDWLLKGGKIYCPQLAEYMLTGQQHKYPALRDIAVNKYGCKEREKRMEVYWQQGIDTKDIPKELVLEDVMNDVLDTEAIMLQQVKEAKKEGMFNLIMEECEGLLATIEMEYNGIYINQDILRRNKLLLLKEIAEANKDLVQISERYFK